MRIGLDARTIYRSFRRGTGKNLIDLYSHLAQVRPDWEVIAYHRLPGPTPPLLPAFAQPRMIEMLGDRLDAWSRWRLPVAARSDGVDVLHCPANTCPYWMPVETVVTIHDLIPLDMPQGRPAAEVRRFEQSISAACNRAAGIICPSRYTRDRLVADFGANADLITVNPWAADSSIRPVSQDECRSVLKRYGITGPFVLHFGSDAPRKNTRRLIEAWATLKPQVRREYQLLVVGLEGHALDFVSEQVDQLGLVSVRLHGFADEADLPALLSAARVLAYPSLSEGFGLPILDAWAAGTVVLSSHVTSLPEVAGDAALLIEPTDVCSIARGLKRLISDVRLRDELNTKARQRLKLYSWEQTSERFATVFERALGLSPATPSRDRSMGDPYRDGRAAA